MVAVPGVFAVAVLTVATAAAAASFVIVVLAFAVADAACRQKLPYCSLCKCQVDCRRDSGARRDPKGMGGCMASMAGEIAAAADE